MKRLSIVVAVMAGCTPQPSSSAVPSETPSITTDARPAATPASELRPFAWDAALVVGWGVVGGPGLASAARVGQRLSVMVDDGAPWTAHVVDVVPCEEGDDRNACPYVSVEYEADDRTPPSPWTRPGHACDAEDVALLDTRLAVTADTALPRFVPHTLEVRYANALCEGGHDDAHFVLVHACTSTGEDPVKGVAELRDVLRYPRRVVTLRVADRTLHFVTVAKVERPRSGRMADIPRTYETAFWVLEDVGDTTTVLHRERLADGRNINQDTSCQLPLRYPTPWGVVETDGVVEILTRASLQTFERWTLTADGLTRAGSFEASIHPMG